MSRNHENALQCTINAEALTNSEYTDMMCTYLLSHHWKDIVAILNDQNTSTAKHHSIAVNCLDLIWDISALGALLLHHPGKLQEPMDEAIRMAQQRVQERGDEDLDFMAQPKESVHLRLHHLPCCKELCKPTVTSIRAADINRLLSVSGTVIRTGVVKMVHQRREYMCTKCKHRFAVECDLEQRNSMPLPLECPSDGLAARPCAGFKFEPVPGTEVCRDYQEVRIQEQVHRLTVGAIPRSITLILQDDLVDRCKPGDDVTVVGVLRKRWRPLAKDQRPDVELAITAEHVRVRNEERGVDHVSRELQMEFQEFWGRHAGRELVARDWLLHQMCPSLSGMYLVKLATLLTLIGGVGHTDSSGMRVRGESHMLLVGDAGVGKSQVLRYAAKLSPRRMWAWRRDLACMGSPRRPALPHRYAAKLSPRSVLTTGIGSTAAGLTCTAVKDTSGEWMLEAGALVLADGGLCCVDEFDSIKNDERTAVLEAMEQQTISVAKAGMVCKLRTKCTVIAATNPKSGKMDKHVALHSQTGLSTPLISRFDIVLLLSDAHDDDRDKRISAHILAATAAAPGAAPAAAAAAASSSSACSREEAWPLDKLRKYIEYVKATRLPTLSEPAQRVLQAYYSRMRATADRDASRSTIRMLEALVRLAQAHARLMFQHEVSLVDACHAILLMEGAQNSPDIVGNDFSVLKSEFPTDPMTEYVHFEKHVLAQLGLDGGGGTSPAKGAKGPAWHAQQFGDNEGDKRDGSDVKRARHGPLDDYMLGGGAQPAAAGPGARPGFSGFH
jgi:DNA helicase MCM9